MGITVYELLNKRLDHLAASAAGRAEGTLFVGIDALPHEGVMYVQQGILDATFLYPTGGEEAIDMALKIRAGEDVPKEIVLGSRIFTENNVAHGGEAIPAP
jgi:ribose transport system substrate-binding protein